MPLGFRFNPFLVANSGSPFDITAGQDLYGDTLFNARPGLPTNTTKPGLIPTKYGLLDPDPSLVREFCPVTTDVDPALSFSTCGCRRLSPLGEESAGAAAAGPQEVTEATGDGSKAARLTLEARETTPLRPAAVTRSPSRWPCVTS